MGTAVIGWRLRRAIVVLLTILAAGTAAADKIVIAHRGASGYLPEHTLEAYGYAHALGADYIEPDLVLTKDGVFICLHDIHLESTTNVEEVFPDRKRDDGKWYAADFTLEEIKQLQVHERLPNRFPAMKSDFEVPTFEEMIEMIQGLNASTRQEAGIYPELKAPAWHRENGLPMEEKFLEILAKHGYEGPDAKVFVQSFELEPLERMREMGSELPQIFLMGGRAPSNDTLEPAGLQELSEVVNGIGPSKTLIERDPAVVKRAHDAGLQVHPYTMRDDSVPREYADAKQELDTFYNKYDVDGLFTDFPDTARAVLESK